mmetsp:Transcript_18330/g.31369  ORF Transcript_18330/g.31369 Transcript_18330/m.31369 type:complete len:258 (-) Transcript_18330:551-1324(-)|eukprot:CAMPEP_0119105808 /NCGR_PEP_ID=MMETSP1180-20130426/3673_1 /TAXON_ID=3052 ORGANISM="Chlamydomonas cf sp, Strain CCMP681" /NCGR_SAMPLE_ID=MMETSP1180 /ASSEMBLY_ACC=CAM_ASM_000741 /LENGTH=257 /DNA_ID=CAMNT_0007090961 /DNA_START=45 /DNA_END=818 /DNA_ORIENTATION=+
MAQQTYTLFVDFMSQPSRALAIFARVTGLQGMQEQQVLIHKREQKSAAHLARSALGKVPLLEVKRADGSKWWLPESAAIFEYLADELQVPQHWLPRTDKEARARVVAALHWYHSTIRAGCARLVFNKVLAAKLGATPDEHLAEHGLTLLKQALPALELEWLTDSQGKAQPFVGGQQPCVADLLMCCEIEQLVMLNKEQHGVDLDEILAGHPRVRQWMYATAVACAPHYEQVHAVLRRVAVAGHGTRSPALSAPSSKM